MRSHGRCKTKNLLEPTTFGIKKMRSHESLEMGSPTNRRGSGTTCATTLLEKNLNFEVMVFPNFEKLIPAGPTMEKAKYLLPLRSSLTKSPGSEEKQTVFLELNIQTPMRHIFNATWNFLSTLISFLIKISAPKFPTRAIFLDNIIFILESIFFLRCFYWLTGPGPAIFCQGV